MKAIVLIAANLVGISLGLFLVHLQLAFPPSGVATGKPEILYLLAFFLSPFIGWMVGFLATMVAVDRLAENVTRITTNNSAGRLYGHH